ncbi:Clustered mitochondria/Translation initiation factor eIF3 subunit 135, putative [Angomonas deanei]|uniref:Clustered mitochondria/Translation initiation factor eIF3 subunit 135, putative n=1 Tax=Angomonas deanei TaxID=59799 RepID=A0A7G2C8Y6_9TRYP|nr:Clustered mitochondria/Translation initiation factor eIF3 subunit 135, putative [Angomonas deanei]
MVKSLSDRKIRQHPSIPGYFYETNGILVQLCIDSGSGVFGGETRAEKVALNYFKSHQMFSVEGPKHLLYVPLMTQLRYNGYVFLATAIPPVSSPACVYAAPSAEKPIDVPDVVAHALTEMGNVFNLEEHVVEVNGERWKTKLPLDLRVYVGTDRRMYLVNTGRLLPPQLPLKAEPVKSRKNSSATTVTHSQFLTESLIHRVRPELLLGSKVSLNPDVAVDKCHSTEDVSHSLDIAEYVRGDGCTSIAGQVGLQFPVDAPLLPILNCLLCEKEMDNEFRFVCCQNPDGCCSICAECYTKRMYETLVQETNKKQESNKGKEDTGRSGEGEDTEGEGQTFISPDSSTPQADFSDVARCGNPKKSPTLFPSLSQIFHINGINLSNLPYVYYRLPPASKFAVKHFLEVEIIARASRQLLHSKLRGSTTPDQVASTIENFFVPLLQERTPNAFKFWSKELGPEITKMYPAIAEPFDTSAIPLDLLVNRVQEVTGVYLTKASIASFVEPLDKRFVQIERVVPRCKTVRFPVLEGSETESEKLEVGNTLEKMLLFWIGYAPEGSVEALQPFYLEDTVGVA